jgi:hypothetical protein
VLGYHGPLGLPVIVVKLLMGRAIVVGLVAYALIPVSVWRHHPLTRVLVGYVGNMVTFALMTIFALLINGDFFRYWRMGLCLPIAPLHQLVFNWLPVPWACSRTFSSSEIKPGLLPNGRCSRAGPRGSRSSFACAGRCT